MQGNQENGIRSQSAEVRGRLTGAILAGGESSRMGGSDKGLLELQGKTLITRVIAAVAPQVGHLIINANRHIPVYAAFGYPVVSDRSAGYAGPLAGVAACLTATDTDYLLCVPCDAPFLPADLAVRLYRRLDDESADICMAKTGDRTQPVCVLLRRNLAGSLRDYLDGGGRKPDAWYAWHRTVTADFSDEARAFMNVNTPADAAAATALLPPET